LQRLNKLAAERGHSDASFDFAPEAEHTRSHRLQPSNRYFWVCLCVQRRLVCSAGIKPAGAKVRRPVTLANEAALRRALESAGIEFIDNNGGGEGVRFRKPQRFNKKQQS
jgi:hypothetical protein